MNKIKDNKSHYVKMTFWAGVTLLLWVIALIQIRSSARPLYETHAFDLPLLNVPLAALRISTTQSGIYAITYNQIVARGIELDELSSKSVSLTYNGEPLPFYVTGEAQDATLYFYAEHPSTVAPETFYKLTPNTPGKTMMETDAYASQSGVSQGTEAIHWEQNDIFVPYAQNINPLTGENDNWFSPPIYAPSNLSIQLNVPTQSINNTAEHLLKLNLWSSMTQERNQPDHLIELIFNDDILMRHLWNGATTTSITTTIAADALQPNNTLVINLPENTAGADAVYFDWVELHYQSTLYFNATPLFFQSSEEIIAVRNVHEEVVVLDVSDTMNPIHLTQLRRVQDTLHFTGQGEKHQYYIFHPDMAQTPRISTIPQRQTPLRAIDYGEYIIIVPSGRSFVAALDPLITHRQAQGMTVNTIPLEQIYDEFGHGNPTPNAIRDFITYVASSAPISTQRYILLIGDASYDYKNERGGKNENILPSPLVFTEQGGYAASDLWYLLQDGERLPRLSIGRFPVQTEEQLVSMIAKITDYENSPAHPWLTNALLVTDETVEYRNLSKSMEELLSDNGYTVQTLTTHSTNQSAKTRDPIISALSRGTSIVNYMGSGSDTSWGIETMNSEDIASLKNRNRAPIFTTFTVINGVFDTPNAKGLSETFVTGIDGGFVAAVSPSTSIPINQALQFGNSFYAYLLSGDAKTIGQALHITHSEQYQTNGAYTHHINLLGDPALHYRIP